MNMVHFTLEKNHSSALFVTKKFKTIDELKAHRGIDTGEKLFVCPNCDNTFSLRNQFNVNAAQRVY